MTATLTVPLQRMGQDVLVIDLYPQEDANITTSFDAGVHHTDPDADNIVKQPHGEFADLAETSLEGVGMVDGHDMFGDFT